jgi:hypothetical protein
VPDSEIREEWQGTQNSQDNAEKGGQSRRPHTSWLQNLLYTASVIKAL